MQKTIGTILELFSDDTLIPATTCGEAVVGTEKAMETSGQKSYCLCWVNCLEEGRSQGAGPRF